MLKRWCSIKKIEVYLLCEILISKDTLQGQKNCCEPPSTSMGTYLFFQIFLTYHSSSFCSELKKPHVQKKFITRNMLLTEMKSRSQKHTHREGFMSISSNASSIWHKTSSKLFLVINILHLVHCFKICFNHILPLHRESSENESNKHVFVRQNCKELRGNLR